MTSLSLSEQHGSQTASYLKQAKDRLTVQLMRIWGNSWLKSQARNREQNYKGSFPRCLQKTFLELHKHEPVEELPYLCRSSSRHSIIVVAITDKKRWLAGSGCQHTFLHQLYSETSLQSQRLKSQPYHSKHSKWFFPETHS